MNYALSLVLIIVLCAPSFVGAEEPVVQEESVTVEEDLHLGYYNGESLGWIYLNDFSFKKASSIQYTDKVGKKLEALSLKDMEKVFFKKNSREEVVFVQPYNGAGATNEKDLESQPKVVNSELEDAKNITEDKPLYKENGVWKN